VSSVDATRHDAGEIKTWFRQHIARLLSLDPEEVDVEADFDGFGLDSVQGVDMVTALEDWLGLDEDLPIDVIFDAASISDAADSVAAILATRGADK
jgi:acyl carrier protein